MASTPGESAAALSAPSKLAQEDFQAKTSTAMAAAYQWENTGSESFASSNGFARDVWSYSPTDACESGSWTTLSTTDPADDEGQYVFAPAHHFIMPSFQDRASHMKPSPDDENFAPHAQGHHNSKSSPSTITTNTPRHRVNPTTTTASMMASESSHFSSYPPLDSVAGIHEAQPYMTQQSDRDYHQMADLREFEAHDFKTDAQRYPSPSAGANDNMFSSVQQPASPERIDVPVMTNNDMDGNTPSPARSKGISKPEREPVKGPDGKYYCNLPDCQEEIKTFSRRCEFNKHMDKHERPYKCTAEGCEKLPGFTYSGGLLRHEREVHNKHGGPKRQLNCPHKSCKRYTGKGFSRAENLNEHIRRVHTSADDVADGGKVVNGDDTEDDALDAQPGQKRKRVSGRSEPSDVQDQLKKLKAENEELISRIQNQEHTIQSHVHQIQSQQQQIQDYADQLSALQQAQMTNLSMHLHQQMQAPAAQML